MIAPIDLKTLMPTDRGSIQRNLEQVRELIRQLKAAEKAYVTLLEAADAIPGGVPVRRMTMAEAITMILSDPVGQRLTAHEIAEKMRDQGLFVRGEKAKEPVYQALQRSIREHGEAAPWIKERDPVRGIVWWMVPSDKTVPADRLTT